MADSQAMFLICAFTSAYGSISIKFFIFYQLGLLMDVCICFLVVCTGTCIFMAEQSITRTLISLSVPASLSFLVLNPLTDVNVSLNAPLRGVQPTTGDQSD